MNELVFGPAGIPVAAKGKGVSNGVLKCRELGLGAMEIEFVRGVWMKEELAAKTKKARDEVDLILTAHAPYYVNLNAKEDKKRVQSRERIMKTARMASLSGAYSITFHPGYYLGMDSEKTYRNIKKEMKLLMQQVDDEGIDLWIRPELTGKPTQFGDLKELLKLSQEFDQVMPCIDWSHMHARTNGKWNTYEEFSIMLEMLEKSLGTEALKNLHCHVSGIEYSEKGERNHLVLDESDMNYKDLMKAIKDFDCRGVIICESPNLEVDASILQKSYESI